MDLKSEVDGQQAQENKDRILQKIQSDIDEDRMAPWIASLDVKNGDVRK